MYNDMEKSHPDVISGRERARYIIDGRIRFNPPVFRADNHAPPLDAEALFRAGYHDAAKVKRGFNAAMNDWVDGGMRGRRPVRL